MQNLKIIHLNLFIVNKDTSILSFRIDKNTEHRINEIIKKNKSIKNKSEFATRSIISYFKFRDFYFASKSVVKNCLQMLIDYADIDIKCDPDFYFE